MTKTLNPRCRNGESDGNPGLASLISEAFPESLGTIGGSIDAITRRSTDSSIWFPPTDDSQDNNDGREEGSPDTNSMNPMAFLGALYRQVALGGKISQGQLREIDFSDPTFQHMLGTLLDYVATKDPTLYVGLFGRDPLTGAYAKGKFEQQLVPRAIAEAETKGTPLSLAWIDFDHFKKVNDEAGHQAGDAVIKRGAYVLMRSIRDNAGGRTGEEIAIGRPGSGDEFAALMPGIGYSQALRVGERLRRNIDNLPDEVEIGGKKYRVPHTTLSIGIAEHRKGMNAEDLKGVADKAVYLSKKDGRNRVTAGDGTNVLGYTTGMKGEDFESDRTAGSIAASVIQQAQGKLYETLARNFRDAIKTHFKKSEEQSYRRCAS